MQVITTTIIRSRYLNPLSFLYALSSNSWVFSISFSHDSKLTSLHLSSIKHGYACTDQALFLPTRPITRSLTLCLPPHPLHSIPLYFFFNHVFNFPNLSAISVNLNHLYHIEIRKVKQF